MAPQRLRHLQSRDRKEAGMAGAGRQIRMKVKNRFLAVAAQ
jgi:hypothetical protein